MAKRGAVLFLAVLALGLPITDTLGFFLFAAVFFGVFLGTLAPWGKSWLIALTAAAFCLVVQAVAQPPRIEEGHNIFLPAPQGRVLEAVLPAPVHATMTERFLARYPLDKRCDSGNCWTRFPMQRAFAFSADALFQAPKYTRVVSRIGFTDVNSLRGGFLNELSFSWYDWESDVKRSDMPYFVLYQWPSAGLAGSRLCFTGEVLWEVADSYFEHLTSATENCRTLTEADGGRRVFGLGMAPQPLSMRLEATGALKAATLASQAARILGITLVAALLIRIRPSTAVGYGALMAVALLLVLKLDPAMLGGMRALEGGNDGIGHAGQGKAILENLLLGKFGAALRGGEDIFYFMPGLRYLRALEGVLFGETNHLYVLSVLAIPGLIFTLARHVLPLRWAVVLLAVVVATPVLVNFGGAYYLWVRQASRGMPDPMGYMFFLAALATLLAMIRGGGRPKFGEAAMVGLLLSLACWLRPNLLAGSGVLLGTLAFHFLVSLRAWRPTFALAVGFSPLLLLPLHNWHYGHKLVLLTSSIDIKENLQAGPQVWVAALRDLASGHVGEPVTRIIGHLREWSWGFEPLHLLVFLTVVVVACRRGTALPLRVISLAATAQQVVLWLYDPRGADYRYSWLAWLLSVIVTLAIVREHGLPVLQRRFPGLWRRLASSRVAAILGRLANSPRWQQLPARIDGLVLRHRPHARAGQSHG